jgi:hypothetical protein
MTTQVFSKPLPEPILSLFKYALVSVWVSFLCGQEGGSEEGRSKVGASSRMKGEKQIQIL